MKRRVLQRLVWHLLGWMTAGLAISVAVSWSLAAFLPQRGWRWTSLDEPWRARRGDSYAISEFRAFGSVPRRWRHLVVPADIFSPVPPAIEDSRSPFSVAVLDYIPPPAWRTWGRLDFVVKHRSSAHGCDHATGWPLPALWYEIGDNWARKPTLPVLGGIPLANGGSVSDVRALPLRPIWWGLAVDSACFGLLAFAAAAGLRRGRGVFRHRRGLCPACGYDLAGNTTGVCPECGRAVGCGGRGPLGPGGRTKDGEVRGIEVKRAKRAKPPLGPLGPLSSP